MLKTTKNAHERNQIHCMLMILSVRGNEECIDTHC